MIVRRVGEPGFAHYLHELRELGVLSRSEVISWMALHGSVIRCLERPLDDGSRIDEDALAELKRELGAS